MKGSVLIFSCVVAILSSADALPRSFYFPGEPVPASSTTAALVVSDVPEPTQSSPRSVQQDMDGGIKTTDESHTEKTSGPAVGPRMSRLLFIRQHLPFDSDVVINELEVSPEDQQARSSAVLIFSSPQAEDNSLGQNLTPASSSNPPIPDWLEEMVHHRDSGTLPSCDGESVSAVHPNTGQCQMLGSVTGCLEGQYFFLDPRTDEPVCQNSPCSMDDVLFNGVCTPEDDEDACPEGMSLTRDPYGKGVCDCQIGYRHWPGDGRCYPALRQGPCLDGNVLAAAFDGSSDLCVDNPCARDGSLLWLGDDNIGCYPLQLPWTGCESEQLLLLDTATQQLVCDQLGLRALFDLADAGCPSGEMRGFGGRCRSPLFQSFRGRRAAEVTEQRRVWKG